MLCMRFCEYLKTKLFVKNIERQVLIKAPTFMGFLLYQKKINFEQEYSFFFNFN